MGVLHTIRENVLCNFCFSNANISMLINMYIVYICMIIYLFLVVEHDKKKTI